MNDDRDRKTHRLAWSSAIAVVVVAFGAPIAGAAGLELPEVPQAPLPAEQLPLPDVPEVPVPGVTTLPVPVEELTGDVGDVVDGVGGAVDDATGGVTDEIGEVVDDVADGAGDAVDDVTGGAGDAVDDVVDDVTDPEGPVGGVVDDVTDPEGPVGGVVGDVTKGVDSVVDGVGGVVDGFVGGLPGTPGIGDPEVPGTDTPGNGGTADTAEEAETLAARIAATVPADGFAANVLAAAEAAASLPAARDLPEPSLIERIARSASDVAQQIAFPLLLAVAVGGFVLVQNRMDRKDPKLALAAVDADEDLLGFE